MWVFLKCIGKLMNDVLSFIVFSVLDLLDFILCYVYKIIDLLIESQWRPCYCYNHHSESPSITTTTGSTSNIITFFSNNHNLSLAATTTKVEIDEISRTLYTRPSTFLSKTKIKAKTKSSTNFTLVKNAPTINVPRWSDCHCHTCNSWSISSQRTLFVHADGPKDINGDYAGDDVLFIHGFISSSAFWTETLFPNLSARVKSTYRLFAVDLLGFGKSPKPHDSLYTIKEHLEMIEKSVLEQHKVNSFHIVAHSLGCILALALAVKHPHSVKSLTLLAPPYFPAPKGEDATEYMMRKVAPRRVWPLIALGASLACWYEHVSRTICLVICKNHRIWEFLTKLITRNRIKTYLIEGFCCHTHNAAWHSLHNIICGSGGKMERYLNEVENRLKCSVNIFHGQDDDLIPVECSNNVKAKVTRAKLKVFDNKDHITIVLGRQQAFATELEHIWNSTCSTPI